MGEKIKSFGKMKLGKMEFEVELNHSAYVGGPRVMHLQSESARLEMPEHEFLQMLSAVMVAKKQLDILKIAEDSKDE